MKFRIFYKSFELDNTMLLIDVYLVSYILPFD